MDLISSDAQDAARYRAIKAMPYDKVKRMLDASLNNGIPLEEFIDAEIRSNNWNKHWKNEDK